MKKGIALILAVMLVFSLCIFSTSAADKTITPSATIGGQTVTMTATGVQDSFTLFDIMTIFGSSGGPYTYALWFDYGGTFSFDKDVTLYYQGAAKGDVRAGEDHSISEGWTEVYVDGEWLICDVDAQLPTYPFDPYDVYMVRNHVWILDKYWHSELTVKNGKAEWGPIINY